MAATLANTVFDVTTDVKDKHNNKKGNADSGGTPIIPGEKITIPSENASITSEGIPFDTTSGGIP